MNRDLIKMALILGLMALIGPFAIDMYLPALPRLADDLGTTETASQMTLTSYFIAFAVAQLFYGPASDMFGRKKPIYAGLAVFALASLGCAFAPDISWLIAFRFFQGLGAAGVMSIPRAIIRDRYTGAEATRLMSTIMLVISVSPMLAPLAGSIIIVPFGWRAVFIAVVLATIVSVLLTMFVLPETLPPEERVPFKLGEMLHAFGILLRDVNFIGLTFIGGLGMAAFFTFLGSASFVYMDFFGLDPTQFSIAFAAGAAGFFIASQFAANAMRWFGPTNLIRGATLGYAAFMLALLAIFLAGLGNIWIMIIMLVLANIFMGFIMPSSMVLSLEEHGHIAGAAASLGGTLQMVLGTITMAVGSAVYNGTPLPMLIIMAICASGTLVLALLTVKNRIVAAA
ncbi:MAG: multidrug effflux MFS transporter [Hyphomicrobiaceae bacterium]|nr:multidrug effflux MFS transporter [Hyphomicrobiaceae bacterium]